MHRVRLPVCLVLSGAVLMPGLAVAEPDAATGTHAICVAHIEGIEQVLGPYDPENAADRVPDLPDCPPATVLRHFTPDLPDGTRAAFCLVQQTTEDGTPTIAGFSEGTRDENLVCTTASRFCERVNASRDAALEIAGLGADADATDTALAAADGVRSLRERAGATILTGSSGAVASTLGNLGASALAAVTAPVALAAGVVSVVAVGGAVYICK